MLTIQQCKSMIFKSGVKYGISPRLISERMLTDDDKQDMLEGAVSQECLDLNVELWIKCEMPDYKNGSTKPYSRFYEVTSMGCTS